mgnify:CR=1 FL=1
MRVVEKVMRDFKPTHLVYLGDALDFDYISKFTEGNIRKLEGKRLKRDYIEFNKMLKRHKKLCGRPKVIYFIGNHEYRLEKYLDKCPQGEGFQEVEYNIEGVDEFIPYNKVWKCGKLSYLHGVYTNQFHAKKHVENYGRNVIYGHTHQVQVYTKVSQCDREDFHTGKSIGCLSDKNPEYLHNRPNSWTHAFHICEMENDGYFSEHTMVINKGKLIWNGKVY